MMGKKTKQSHLFYNINMSDMIPDNHMLKLINKHIDFSFIREKTKHLYSHTGRPSIDPEILIRMLLIGYLYGITSERRLCEEVNMHIGYRWFVGLNLNDKVPDHSTFSKNRHSRFKESSIFKDIFDEIVGQCIDLGFVSGKHLSVDGTLVKANASIDSMEPIVVKMDTATYIDSIDKEAEKEIKTQKHNTDKHNEDNNLNDNTYAKRNATTQTIYSVNNKSRSVNVDNNKNEDKNKDNNKDRDENRHKNKDKIKSKNKTISNKTHKSKTDPDAILTRKSNTATRLFHIDNYLMDNKHRIIVGVKASIATKKGESISAIDIDKIPLQTLCKKLYSMM